jgi:hypothetical protein
MHPMGRVVGALVAVALLVHVARAWRDGTMPLVFGRDDAEYFGERQPRLRKFNLVFLAVFSLLILFSAAVG